MSKKEILFSITAKDCKWDYSRGSGKGGQKRNKTESKVRCTHIASGAVGASDDSRSQHKNKHTAFRRMANTEKFKNWHKLECARRSYSLKEIEEKVDKLMSPVFIREEVFREGKWTCE